MQIELPPGVRRRKKQRHPQWLAPLLAGSAVGLVLVAVLVLAASSVTSQEEPEETFALVRSQAVSRPLVEQGLEEVEEADRQPPPPRAPAIPAAPQDEPLSLPVSPPRPAGAPLPSLPRLSGARGIVEAYLQENLDDPDYQIVRWFPESSLSGAWVWSPPEPEYHLWSRRYYDFWRPAPPGTAIRVKYRARIAGQRTLCDRAFLIRDGRVFKVLQAIDLRLPGEGIEAWAARVEIDSYAFARQQDASYRATESAAEQLKKLAEGDF